jgi:hypothetical protein
VTEVEVLYLQTLAVANVARKLNSEHCPRMRDRIKSSRLKHLRKADKFEKKKKKKKTG